MTKLWKAADSGNWHNFIKLFDGPNVERKDFIVTVAKKWNDKPNRYQEPSGYQAIRINFGRVVIATRNYQWRIEYQKNRRRLRIERYPMEWITYQGCLYVSFLIGAIWPPWSTVNNCT